MATLSEDVEVTCPATPVQIEGKLADGRFFYFRSRFERATLGASAESMDRAVEAGLGWTDDQRVERDLSHLGKYGAGCIGLDEAFELLREMAADLTEVPS